MPVPNIFANATSTIPLSQLDANFATTVTLGNTAIQLGNTVTTLNNMTLANVTITSGSATISSGNITATLANGTVSNTTVSNAVSNTVNVVGYMGMPQNSQNGNYDVVLGDAGKHIYHPAGQAAATYTFPANSNVSFTVGTAVTIINGSANNVTISMTSDTLTLANSANTGSRTLVANGVATCVKIANTSWIISGVGLS
jgi:hypothetical protein